MAAATVPAVVDVIASNILATALVPVVDDAIASNIWAVANVLWGAMKSIASNILATMDAVMLLHIVATFFVPVGVDVIASNILATAFVPPVIDVIFSHIVAAAVVPESSDMRAPFCLVLGTGLIDTMYRGSIFWGQRHDD